MAAPSEILELIARFEEQMESYKSGDYNETQVRREFLDPFFKALGWDIDNTQRYAEAYKDVVHDDAIRIGDSHKAPDYCFRIGGTRKFFLEAKKPSVLINDGTTAAYQLRRYGWSAKLPLSILSNFEEFTATDSQIDRLVYDLYGLTEDEIKIVEGQTESAAAMPDAEPSLEIKPRRARAKSPFARAPKKAAADITPEKAYADAAHFYGKEEAPPYRTNNSGGKS